ncbi:DUF4276 family protein [Marinobacter nauticus]|uniref:DUF4276 family protein n=1 Tax=Marinobacter nauticus TaxID=2743 RepID=UPI001CFE7568|nr:DUF4276 family protein [Marinobacter nauticus]
MYNAAVGFIVEGHGEYAAYPSLFCRIVDATGAYVPCVNAGGCGSVFKNTHEHLDDLVRTGKPRFVIITVDYIDLVDQRLAPDLRTIREIFKSRIDSWMEKAKVDGRIKAIPESIKLVVQVHKFESWLIADYDSLLDQGFLIDQAPAIDDSDAVKDPAGWVKKHFVDGHEVKSPAFVKKVVAAIDVDAVSEKSKSFSIFHRSCKRYYDSWLRSSYEC